MMAQVLRIADIPDPKERQIAHELSQAGTALDHAKANLEAANAQYQMTLERVRTAFLFLDEQLTQSGQERGEVVGTQEVRDWMKRFPVLRSHIYSALSLSEAIHLVLCEQAENEPLRYSLAGIVYRLKIGGFQFKTSSPLRECNAALLRLKHIKRDAAGNYWLEPKGQEPDDVPFDEE